MKLHIFAGQALLREADKLKNIERTPDPKTFKSMSLDRRKNPKLDETPDTDKIIAQIAILSNEINNLSFQDGGKWKKENNSMNSSRPRSISSIGDLTPVNFSELFTIRQASPPKALFKLEERLKQGDDSSEEFYTDGYDSEPEYNYNEQYPDAMSNEKIHGESGRSAEPEEKTSQLQSILKILQEGTEKINGFIQNEMKEGARKSGTSMQKWRTSERNNKKDADKSQGKNERNDVEDVAVEMETSDSEKYSSESDDEEVLSGRLSTGQESKYSSQSQLSEIVNYEEQSKDGMSAEENVVGEKFSEPDSSYDNDSDEAENEKVIDTPTIREEIITNKEQVNGLNERPTEEQRIITVETQVINDSKREESLPKNGKPNSRKQKSKIKKQEDLKPEDQLEMKQQPITQQKDIEEMKLKGEHLETEQHETAVEKQQSDEILTEQIEEKTIDSLEEDNHDSKDQRETVNARKPDGHFHNLEVDVNRPEEQENGEKGKDELARKSEVVERVQQEEIKQVEEEKEETDEVKNEVNKPERFLEKTIIKRN